MKTKVYATNKESINKGILNWVSRNGFYPITPHKTYVSIRNYPTDPKVIVKVDNRVKGFTLKEIFLKK